LVTHIDPIHFSSRKKWYGIRFSSFSGHKSISRAKKAIKNFVRYDYALTSVTAKINNYIDEFEEVKWGLNGKFKAESIDARKGKIEISGEFEPYMSDQLEDNTIKSLPKQDFFEQVFRTI